MDNRYYDLLRQTNQEGFYDSINDYLDALQKTKLSDAEVVQLTALQQANIHLEMIGDVVETEIVGLGIKMLDEDTRFSETTSKMLEKLYNKVRQAVEISIKAITGPDEEAADEVLAMKMEIRRLEEEILAYQRTKLTVEPSAALKQLQSDIKLIERMRHIYSLTKRMVRGLYPEKYDAKEVLETA